MATVEGTRLPSSVCSGTGGRRREKPSCPNRSCVVCFSLSRPERRWRTTLWERCLRDGVSPPRASERYIWVGALNPPEEEEEVTGSSPLSCVVVVVVVDGSCSEAVSLYSV